MEYLRFEIPAADAGEGRVHDDQIVLLPWLFVAGFSVTVAVVVMRVRVVVVVVRVLLGEGFGVKSGLWGDGLEVVLDFSHRVVIDFPKHLEVVLVFRPHDNKQYNSPTLPSTIQKH
jgi:hypothetical protein